jgi:muramoyltetrapeptide carboxypeptidase LdcA involved in peptidoglycan recycling
MEPRLPPTAAPGDRVAVLSPAWAAPAHFPDLHEQGLRRIRELFDLEPVEYPSTRRDSSPQERARDLNAAFSDPDIAAVMATIGGEDQITVLRHLDEAAMTQAPKRFIGYSDNTNLLNWLWCHGVGGVHGGSTQHLLAPGPRPDAEHLESLRVALFGGDLDLRPVTASRDAGLRWEDPAALTETAPVEPAEPWTWAGPVRVVTGPTWGGCLEIVHWTMAVGRWMLPPEEYAGCVLFLENDEERPPPDAVYRMLRNLGERGILGQAAAVIWARPPVGGFDERPGPEEASVLRADYREAVLRAVATYCPDVPVVMDVDIGHTSPQWLLPYGGRVTVDAERQVVTAHFG